MSLVPGQVITQFTPNEPLELGEYYTLDSAIKLAQNPTRVRFFVDSAIGDPITSDAVLQGRSFAFFPGYSNEARLDDAFAPYWNPLTVVWGIYEPHLPVMTITGVAGEQLSLTFWVKDDDPEASVGDAVQDFCSPTLSVNATWSHGNTAQFSLPWFPGPGVLNVGDGSAEFRVTFSPEGVPVWSDHIYGQDARFLRDYGEGYYPWGEENPDFVPCESDGEPWCVREWIFQGLEFNEVTWTTPIEPIAQANCHPRCAESANNPDCAL